MMVVAAVFTSIMMVAATFTLRVNFTVEEVKYDFIGLTAAAVENGWCQRNADIRVTLLGGELTVNVSEKGVLLTGGATTVYQGTFEF